MINKKRIVAIILLVCLMLTACGAGSANGSATNDDAGSAGTDGAPEEIQPVEVVVDDTPDLRPRVDAISYRMSLDLDTKKDLLGETVTMTIKNNTDSDVAEVVIKNMAAGAIAYAKENYDSKVNQALTSNVYGIYAGAPTETVAGAPENALEYRYTDDDESLIIATLGSPLKPGETTELTVVMDTKIPYRQDRFAVQKSRHGKEYTISFCFPYLADNEQVDANEFMAKGAIRKTLIENIAWDTAPFFDDGESRSADLADYDVEFVVPSDYEVAAVGASKREDAADAADATDAADAADTATYSIKATNVRDFAIVACNHMEKETFDVNGVTVNSYYLTGGNETDEYRKICNLATEESIKLFTEKIGPYPYEELDVVECLFGFAFGGMEYPGLVMINGNSFFEGMGAEFGAQPLVDVVSHEIGHQWFYSAVGNNEYREGWLDEAFATYAERELFNMADNETNAYLRELDKDILSFEEIQADRADYLKFFKQEFDNYYINIAPDEYDRDRSYGEGEYEAGFLFLVELKQLWGEEWFDEFLKTYFKNYSGHIAETKDIVALIRAFDVNGAAEDTIKYFIKE